MNSTQILKGILEGCLLAVISEEEVYGYEMTKKLEQYGFNMVSEGSIYPLLIRMKKEGLVDTVTKASDSGPKRKYYSLTELGREELRNFIGQWEKISSSVNNLIEGKLDLNLYLISTGKSEKEIKEFIEEAEEHLILGEKEGKTVEDIFGTSPEEYAKSVANEMSFDKKEVIQCISMFIFGFFAWIFMGKIENFQVGISFLEIVSIPVIYFLTIVGLLFVSKRFAFKDKKLTISIFSIFIINIISLIAVQLIGKNMTNIILLNKWLVNIIIILLIIASVIISLKINTWILMLPFIFYAPTIISNFIGINFDKINIVLSVISCIIAIIFIKFESKRITKE